MAQAVREERSQQDITRDENDEKVEKSSGNVNNVGGGGFKFNVHAAEFVPRSHHSSVNFNNASNDNSSGYFYPCMGFMEGSTASPSDWFYVNSSSTAQDLHGIPSSFTLFPGSIPTTPLNHPLLTQDLQQKIIKQVEYLFSDLSLMANDSMAKHVSKDPEGYVPIPVIASMKKIKALVTDHHLLVQALRSSTKLVISKDSKKVKRRSPFTEHYKDELQYRTVIVENLPDDHSYQNLEKIFSVVGSVKAIRLCHPPEANPSRSKNDVIISNKLHALVEYDNVEIAERAAERLNDERNWRKGMRVRVMQRRTPKSVLKGRKLDFDILTDDDEVPFESSEETSPLCGSDALPDINTEENAIGSRKGVGAGGRGKTKGRMQMQCQTGGRGLLASPTHSSGTSPFSLQCDTFTKQLINKGPTTPDGTRGFTLGRGKPLSFSSA